MNHLTMPQATEVEQRVIGSMLMEPNYFELMIQQLTTDHFHGTANRVVFDAMQQTESNDTALIVQHLQDNGKLEQAGGINCMFEYMGSASAPNDAYIEILNDKLHRRRLISEFTGLVQSAYDNETELQTILDHAYNASTSGTESELKILSVPEIIERDKNTPKAEKLYTGIDPLDNGIYAESMRRGQTILTIADSGHGKTQYALFMAEKLLRQGYKIAWFQLEGYDSETANYINTVASQYGKHMWVADSIYDIDSIKRYARILKKKHDIDYIVIDYIQNVEYSKRGIGKVEQVEYISKHITRMAKDLNVVCNPLSQVTINYDARPGWKAEPRYGDVRWSQQMKQDATLILSVFRPSRIDSLTDQDANGKLIARNWKDEQVPYNSVFVKQAKSRHGEQKWARLHLVHGDLGLQLYTHQQTEEGGIEYVGDDRVPF